MRRILVLATTALALLAGCADQPERINPPPKSPESVAIEQVTIVRVSDGDTIRVRETDGDQKSIRVIGIDTPETIDPNNEVQCYGPEATREGQRILSAGQEAILVFDPSQARFDRYSRTLAYIQVPGVVGDYGLHMVREGFAEELTYGKAYARQKAYRAAQSAAQTEQDGLWGQRTNPTTEECRA